MEGACRHDDPVIPADRSPPSRTRFRQRACALLLGAVLCLPVGAQEAAGGDETAGKDEPPAAAPAIAELFGARERLQEFALSLEDLDSPGFLAERTARADELRAEFRELGDALNPAALETLSFEGLLDLQTEIRAELRAIELLGDELTARATERDEQLDKLAAQRERWNSLVETAREREAPAAVLDVIARAERRFEDVERRLKADRDATLTAISSLLDLKLDTVSLRAELQARREALELASQTAGDAPLWDGRLWDAPLGGPAARAELRREAISLIDYFREHGSTFLLWLTGVFVFVFWLLKASGARVSEHMQKDSVSLKASAIFERPISASLLAALLGAYWLAPEAPVAFSHLIWMLVPIPAATLAVTVFAKPIRLSAYTLALVLVLLRLEVLLGPVPLADRLFVVLQSLGLAGAFALDLARGNWSKAFPAIPAARLGILVRAACGLFLIIMLIDVVGLVGLARTLRNLVFGGLGLGMIFVAAAYVLTGLVLALLWVRPLSALDIVKRERWRMVKTLRRLIRLIAGAGWLVSTLSISGLMAVVLDFVNSALGEEVEIGAVTISVSALVYGALILLLTVLISRLVRFFMESSATGGEGMAIGAAFAISKLLRYAIAVAGFLFAIVVMGFDLTSVTVLAGALGVGIGFGLQAIFNNFISGLILLLEQPIKIGDIAKVGDLMGTVREVGIRSTVVETFDGAEVIVPNADLISKTVLNWTKSNRRRRAEIDVGVAYGTRPERVLDILRSAAAECEEVADDPQATAVFTGFGDSSLNFRLYVWLKDLSNILVAPSRIRQDILEKLDEAGVEVPFPQRDIRVVMQEGGNLPPDEPVPAPAS